LPYAFVVHWQHDEVASFSEPIRDAGWRVDTAHDDPHGAADRIARARPDVVVLSLRRDPDAGLELARILATTGADQDVPVLLTVDGDDETVAGVRQHLPTATAVTWPDLPATLAALSP
jgi:DNA-binding response OmpR family regulator